MKRLFLVPLIGLFAFIVSMIFINSYLNEANDMIQEIDDEMKSRVGDTLIIMKDTLLIVDYSLIGEEYILSNGTKISQELAK